MHEKDDLRIIPLGGVEEVGLNCTVFEYKKQILVVDMGLGFPDGDMYGVDYVVPNPDYLIHRKHKIEGIVLTHGHLDHIGGIPFLIEKLDFPDIWGTEYTIALVKRKLEEAGLLKKAKLHIINEDSHLKADSFELSFFRVNHSIPQSVGIVIKTPAATVVHTGDFKFDNSPVNEPVTDYVRLAEIGEAGVDLLLSDSTNAMRKGHPVSETEVANNLKYLIENTKGRVIIATFSGLVGRLYQLIKIAESLDRKVAIAGYGMQQALEIAQEIGYINPNQDVFIPIEKVNRYNDENVMILTTGVQGEHNAALARMASNEGYRNISIKNGDTVVLSAATIPGNNSEVQNLMDKLSIKGAHVVASDTVDFFTSGHGYQEDHKIMLNLIKPNYFMPVHGYQYFLQEHARTALSVGVSAENILITQKGSVIEGNQQSGFSISNSIKAYPLLVSGSGVGDVGPAVLGERKQLGNSGMIIINILLDLESRSLAEEVSIITKGFVFVKTSGDLLEEIKKIAIEEVQKGLRRYYPPDRIGENIITLTKKLAKESIKREPVIVPIINTFNKKEA